MFNSKSRQTFPVKFSSLLALLPLLLFLTSCEPGCVESDEFDTKSIYIDSNPIGHISGTYDDVNGGQNADWKEVPDLRTSGEPIVLAIKGGWTSWEETENEKQLRALPVCVMCAKKEGLTNCICVPGQKPEPEKDYLGNNLKDADGKDINCEDAANQDDPRKCTCSNRHGTISDPGVYFFATNYKNKDETLKIADEQEACRYSAGTGLYIGLFGKDGRTGPSRVYQTYPSKQICDITKNARNECVDEDGVDQAKYIYYSPNGKIFVKGAGGDSASDEYHKAGERAKLIINDSYYSDNYGGYFVNFISGFTLDADPGLLEYIVSVVEDVMMGKIVDGERVGGVLEFTYNAIVKDSTFILIVQMFLIFYVVLFGIWVLSGQLQISNKEVSRRLIKLALVIFFTTETSWHFYNQIVISFFKDGMDYLISMFMDLSDRTLDPDSLIITSQLDRANELSYATRFSYIDLTIKKLFSAAVSKKIWGLFFGELFGVLYIPIIYALIFFFLYVMLMAAFAYITALLRLVFVLCLGPIFIIMVLFNKTDEIYKRWLAFIAAQSFQMVCLFLILYLFVVIINEKFTTLFAFRTCTHYTNFGLFHEYVLKSSPGRSLPVWVSMFAGIGALLFLLYHVIQQIPPLAGHLVKVSGQAANTAGGFADYRNSNKAFALAFDVLGKATALARDSITDYAPRFGRFIGTPKAFVAIKEAIPVRGPIGMYRDHKIDKVIKQQMAKGKAEGKTGADLDKFVRKGVFEEIGKMNKFQDGKHKGKGRSDFLGAGNQRAILDRLDRKLVHEPLMGAVKDAAKKIKKEKGANVPLSKDEMYNAIKGEVRDWASKNSYVGVDRAMELMETDKFKKMAQEEGALSSSEAARIFAGNEEGKNRFLQHLQEQAVANRLEEEQMKEKGLLERAGYGVAKFKHSLSRDEAYNPEIVGKNFVAKEYYEEKYASPSDGLVDQGVAATKKAMKQSALNRFAFNKINPYAPNFSEMEQEAQKKMLLNYFEDDKNKNDAPEKQKEFKQAFEDAISREEDQYKLREAVDSGDVTPEQQRHLATTVLDRGMFEVLTSEQKDPDLVKSIKDSYLNLSQRNILNNKAAEDLKKFYSEKQKSIKDKIAKLEREQIAIEGDPNLSDEERDRKINDLESQIGSLQGEDKAIEGELTKIEIVSE
ncbi:MAG: virB6 [Rickettsiaceae bacterium]|jgi:type IV secretory pathway VirB6-like protein|nr:virB6 [Rickettsiaceae bacterium]